MKNGNINLKNSIFIQEIMRFNCLVLISFFIALIVFMSIISVVLGSMEESKITYSMPASFEVYENEKKEFDIKVNNAGNTILHNIVVDISGIPQQSFSVFPTRTDSLDLGKSTSFIVTINSQYITKGPHLLRINISSEETSETTTMILNVKAISGIILPTTTTISPEDKKRMEAAISIVKSLMIVAGIIAVVMVIVNNYLKKKSEASQQITEEKSEEIKY